MASRTSVEGELDRSETHSSAALRRLAVELAADPGWIPTTSREVAEAILHEFPQLRDDDELRATTYAGSDSNVRQIIEILEGGSRSE